MLHCYNRQSCFFYLGNLFYKKGMSVLGIICLTFVPFTLFCLYILSHTQKADENCHVLFFYKRLVVILVLLITNTNIIIEYKISFYLPVYYLLFHILFDILLVGFENKMTNQVMRNIMNSYVRKRFNLLIYHLQMLQ